MSAARTVGRRRRLDSHLHGVGSADLGDHPAAVRQGGDLAVHPAAPAARAGTTTRRSRASSAPTTTPSCRRRTSVIVRRVTGDEAAALQGLGRLPADRPAVRPGLGGQRDGAADRRPGRRSRSTEPVVVTFDGADADEAVGRARGRPVRRARQGPGRDGARGQRHPGRQHRDRRRRRRPRSSSPRMEEWADDAVHLSHHHIRVGRDATRQAHRADLRRRPGPGGRHASSTTARAATSSCIGLYFADAGQHLEHRLFVDHAVPHCKSRALYKGALQGAEGAHGLDRRRADPQGRRGHRHLRDEPQPAAHRGRPRRLGAEPGDRDRRDRRRRARQRHRPVRRRAAVLPAVPGHPAGGGQAPGGARLLRRGAAADRHPVGASSGPPRSSSASWPSPASESTLHRDFDTTSRRRTHNWSQHTHGNPGHPRPARLGHHRRGPDRDPARRRPDRLVERDARDHGPQRLRQVDPGLLAGRSPQVPRHLRAPSPSTARTCWP